jgi:hypothetical protein
MVAATAISIYGCNNGGGSNNPAGPNPYTITDYSLVPNSQTNCTLNGSSVISCNSNSVIAAIYTVSFVESSVGAYVVVPPVGNTYGLTVASNGCNQAPSASGTTYTCGFNLSGSNVQKGNSFYLTLNGQLGTYNLIKIELN